MRARYFLAVPVDGVAARRLSRLARASADDAARYVHPKDLHITLCYFGPQRDGVIRGVMNALDPGQLPRAFVARLVHVGPFAATGGRHAVALPDAPATSRLRALYVAIPSRVHRAVPKSAAHRPYRPHVTLARRPRGGAWRETRGRLVLHVDTVALYRSRQDPGRGPRYRIVRHWRLRGGRRND